MRRWGAIVNGFMTRRHGIVAGGVAFAVIVGLLLTRGGDQPSEAVTAEPQPSPSASASAKPGCSTAKKAFIPTSMSISGVKTIAILPLGLDTQGIPGTPPLTSAGKQSMAFDISSGIKPGSKAGHALFNAHTYPDGSALGNTLLDKLNKGDQIVVKGLGGQICYKVTKESEVAADSRDSGYFDTEGKPEIAIVVCSGQRLGPGVWTKRTIWFASPVA